MYIILFNQKKMTVDTSSDAVLTEDTLAFRLHPANAKRAEISTKDLPNCRYSSDTSN